MLVLTKGPLLSSTSLLAQGGIAAAVGEDDDPSLHAEDTLRTGRGLCRPSAVTVLTDEAPARIRDLVELGVEFDDGLGLEGGHSRRRVVHAGGAATGDRVARKLAERVLAHPRIEVAEGERMLSVWRDDERCVGVVTDRRAVAARATLLSTGGAAALWERTTNPAGAVGEGMAAAYRAGAALADLEFVQFHPTTLVDSSLLLSEALRGEGAVLLDDQGNRFTDELAPRDVVAREIAARGTVLLDLRAIDRGRFPSLMGSLVEEGYDPAQTPIPVAPAAHYTVGGVLTDLDGRSELPGLYAAGECAATGVHGANRLASNSLLECLVFGRRAALAALGEPAVPGRLPAIPGPPANEPVTPELRSALWRDCGLIRDAAGLEHLLDAPHLLTRLIARDARSTREESRGSHFRADFPSESEAFERHVVLRHGLRARARDMAVATDTLERVVLAALAEDIGAGDVTTEATVPADAVGVGRSPREGSRRRLRPARRRGDVPRARPGHPLRGARERRRRRRAARRRRARHRLGARDPHRRARRAQLPRPAVRDRDAHAPLRRRGRGHGRRRARHAQDDARPARAREVRRRLRRRPQPPLRPRRRRAVKDNHLRAAGSVSAAVELVRAATRRCRSRSSATRSSRSAKRSPPASTRSSSTT